MQTDPKPANADPHRALEEACVEEYRRAHGHTRENLARLPADAASSILASARRAAAERLAEIECRAHWVRGVHHT